MKQAWTAFVIASGAIVAMAVTIPGMVRASAPVNVSAPLVTLILTQQKTISHRPIEQIGKPFDPIAASLRDMATMKVGAGDWPQWGGTGSRNNTPKGRNISADWDVETKKNIKWAAQLGSQTYGNPSVANGKVFIGTNNWNGYLKRYPAKIDLGVMLCFEEATGKFLWQYSSPKLATGRVNDWAQVGMPSTPVVDGDRLWAVTNRCEVVCLDTDGFHDGENDGPHCNEVNENLDEADIVWKFDMIKELGVFPHNMSTCSILIADGVLFVCTSNGVDDTHLKIPAPDAPSFLAMDRDTGQVLWTDNSPGTNILHGQWASPSYGEFDGQPQVIFPGGDGWVYSFDPKGDGRGGSRLLWKFDANPKESIYLLGGRATRNSIIAFPAIYDGLVYITVGEDPEHGEGVGHLWCIDPANFINGEDVSECLAVDESGDQMPHRRLQAINVKQGEQAVPNPNSAVRWHYFSQDRNGNGKIEFEEQYHRSLGTPAIKDDILYVSDIAGVVHCLNAKTGERYWIHDLFAASWGSVLIVDDKVYVGDEDGKISIFCHSSNAAIAMPDGAPLAELKLINSVYSTPIVANNVLYIADKSMLYAIQEQPDRPRIANEIVANSLGMDLVLIPPGKFRMGGRSPYQRVGSAVDVTLSNGFYLGRTEVTQRQWRDVMGTTPWKGKDHVREGDNYPATFVSWDDAKAFCAKLSEKENTTYRLPTEAEWEYACRAGSKTRFGFGDDAAELSNFAWWGGHSPLGNTNVEDHAHEVGTKRANGFGLNDMHGNVWEWCDDFHAPALTGGIDPRIFDGGSNRVFRGGSWDTEAIKCGSGFRFVNLQWGPKSDLGFRVLRVRDSSPGRLPEPTPIRSLAGQHQKPVMMAVFSPDDEIVATTSEDGKVVLWQWRDRKTLHVLNGHAGGVLIAAFSPDGRTVATGGRDSKVILWDVSTGAARTIINDHTGAVVSVLYSQNGTTLFTGSSDTTVKVRDADGTLRYSLPGHRQEVIALALSDDGKRLVSGGGNWTTPTRHGEVKVWDLETRQVIWSGAGEFGGIWSVAISPDGKQLATASLDGAVRLWDFNTGRLLSTLRGHTDRVMSVAYEPDSNFLASASLDGCLYVWDLTTSQGFPVTPWNNHRAQRVTFSNCERLMVTAGLDGTAMIWTY